MLKRKTHLRHGGMFRKMGSLGPRDICLGQNLDDLEQELEQLDRQCDAAVETFTSLLRRCNRLSDAKRIHRHILSSVHCRDRLLLNLLVEMYGKCGSLEYARGVFDRIPQKNVFSWTIMMAAYTQSGHLDKATQLFRIMIAEGVKGDKISFVTLLDACSTAIEGEEIYKYIAEAGFDSDLIVANAIVNMYGKCGSIIDARFIFEKLENRDVISWNTMVAACSQNGAPEESLLLLNRMNQEGMKADTVTFISTLNACSSLGFGFAGVGKQIHERVITDHVESNTVVGNALVNMYSKCGMLEYARQVFEKMNKDVVSWNAMIGAYVKHGLKRNALDLFRKMNLECISPNRVTFISIFQAAAEVEDYKLIQQGIAFSGLDLEDVVVRNTVVQMHGRVGCLENAKRVFDGMPKKNSGSWNTIVDAYAHNGHATEAVELFRKMLQEGVRADEVTFLTVVDNCWCAENGNFIYNLIMENGLDSSAVVMRTALMQMFSKCGRLVDAERMFYGMSGRDLFAWNTMLAVYTQQGYGEDAVRLFRMMSIEGIRRDGMTLGCMLDTYSNMGHWMLDEGRKVHDHVIEEGMLVCGDDIVLANALINMYGKCGSVEEAREVFDAIADEERNVVTWNSMLAAYGANFQHPLKNVLALFRQMQLHGMVPNKVSYLSCIEACNDVPTAKGIHSCIIDSGWDSDTSIGANLISMYGRLQSLKDAEASFIHTDDVAVCTAMIAAYGECGKGSEGIRLWMEMLQLGVEGDNVLLACVVEACENLMQGKIVHYDYVNDGGVIDGDAFGCALVRMYGRLGSLQDAKEVFDGIQNKESGAYNAMMGALGVDGGVEMVRKMDIEGVKMNKMSLVGALDVCANSGALEEGRRIHKSMREGAYWMCNDMVVENTMLNMYAKCGSLKESKEVFEGMKKKGVVTWNSMICGFAHHGDIVEARKHMWRMQQDGVRADGVTLTSIAAACHHAGYVEEALLYVSDMIREYSVVVSGVHLTCLVGVLSRIGFTGEAERVIEERMGGVGDDDGVALRNLLSACRIHDDLVRGVRVGEKLMGMNCRDSAPYVALSNIYSGDTA